MTQKSWIVFAAIVLVLFGGLFYLSNKDAVNVDSVDGSKVLAATADSGNIADHVFGVKNSKVLLVEYGDYQCPGCGSAYQPIKTLTEKYQNQLTFVFRNFPLTSIHPNAKAAAAAVEAAGLEGKYWEMHNILYENQSSWVNSDASSRGELFAGYAAQIGLNKDTFTKTLNDNLKSIDQKIAFDQALGKKAGVDGTPTFYLNGKEVTQYVKDGKVVSSDTSGASPIWSDPQAFDTYVLQPAFKTAGIDISQVK